MKADPLPARRALLKQARDAAVAALLGPMAWRSARAAVERGAPQQLPLQAVAELGLDSPAMVGDESADLAVLTLGGMEITSGVLVATDALLLDGQPLARRVEPGRYPLQIVLARLGSGEERVALLQLKLAQKPAVRWEGARAEGDEADEHDGEVEGFDIESGVACLIDAAAMVAWKAELETRPEALQALESALRENRRPIWTWARVRAGGAAGVLVTAGFGEGNYAAWWGLDAAGNAVSLVLDFDLVEWAGLPEEEPTEV